MSAYRGGPPSKDQVIGCTFIPIESKKKAIDRLVEWVEAGQVNVEVDLDLYMAMVEELAAPLVALDWEWRAIHKKSFTLTVLGQRITVWSGR